MKTYKLAMALTIYLIIYSSTLMAIIGGEDANENEFSWYAKLFFNGTERKSMCGGSLIAKQWIITAAHCFEPEGSNIPSNIKIIFPNYISDTETSSMNQEFSVKKIIIHPDYLEQTKIKDKIIFDGILIDDIALVQLEQAIEDIDPVPIQHSTLPIELNMTLIGLGIKEASNTPFPATLQKVNMPVLSYQQCINYSHAPYIDVETGQLTNSEGLFITKDMLCFSDIFLGGKGGCSGNSGGPVIYNNSGSVILKGVISKIADNCAFPDSPFDKKTSIAINVDEYIDFINFVLKEDKAPTNTNLITNGNNTHPDFSGWVNKNSRPNDYFYKGKEFGDWQEGFFGTSYKESSRIQFIDVLNATGKTQEELDNKTNKIEVSEFFAKTYCGGDQYKLMAILYDENKNELDRWSSGIQYLSGDCRWDNDIWQQERHVFNYPKGLRYIAFEDSGKGIEIWNGFYGSKMTLATVRLKSNLTTLRTIPDTSE